MVSGVSTGGVSRVSSEHGHQSLSIQQTDCAGMLWGGHATHPRTKSYCEFWSGDGYSRCDVVLGTPHDPRTTGSSRITPNSIHATFFVIYDTSMPSSHPPPLTISSLFVFIIVLCCVVFRKHLGVWWRLAARPEALIMGSSRSSPTVRNYDHSLKSR